MTEQTTGEAPWAAQYASAETAPARAPRQRRKPREVKPEALTPAPKKPRVAKKEKSERAAPETIKVTMREYAEMRVGDDAKVFIKLHGILSALTKGARTKVLAELSKVFG